MQTINLPNTAWFGPKVLEIQLPESWNVQTCYMQGYNRPAISDQVIIDSLRNPLGVSPLHVLARGKKEVVVVFDDLTRVTRTAQIVPHVLNELKAAGINEQNIRFICGTGLHGVMNRSHFVKKLGEEIVSRYAVYSHNPFGNCQQIGSTDTFQTHVYINEEYLKCDLKIVIGACVPHAAAGFGGGSKLILPGLASFETINHHHTLGGARMDAATKQKPTQGMGIVEHNRFKQNIDEAAELAGIDFLINTTINLWGDSVAIFSGEWKTAYAAALKDALVNYRTPRATGFDLVISNSYAKVSESMISLAAAIPLVCTCGGDIVIIANAPEGQVTHYIAGKFGKTTFARHYSPCAIPDYVNQVIVYNEFPHPGSTWFPDNPKIVYFSRWEDVLAQLQKSQGSSASVAVIPDATNQYFDWYS
jgi:nickel-dependent lactate racemase